jgi:hypothetical protein
MLEKLQLLSETSEGYNLSELGEDVSLYAQMPSHRQNKYLKRNETYISEFCDTPNSTPRCA